MPEDLDIDVSFTSRAWLRNMPDVEDKCHRAASAAYTAVAVDNLDQAEVSIVLADDDQVQQLNRDYRGQDKSTNVLSFASVDDLGAPRPSGAAPVMLGDVIIAYGVAATEAEDEGKSLTDHLSHLVVHGMLHLLGHDHIEDDEADRMETLERSILNGLGIDDPYRESLTPGNKDQDRMSAS